MKPHDSISSRPGCEASIVKKIHNLLMLFGDLMVWKFESRFGFFQLETAVSVKKRIIIYFYVRNSENRVLKNVFCSYQTKYRTKNTKTFFYKPVTVWFGFL